MEKREYTKKWGDSDVDGIWRGTKVDDEARVVAG